MIETESLANDRLRIETYSHRLVILAILSAMATMSIATFYPSGKPADDLMTFSFSATYLWIASQSFALTLPGLFVGMVLGRFAPKTGAVLGAVLILLVPVVVLCDAMTFNWIAERFLSGTMGRIVSSLLPALALHVTPSSVVQGVVMVVVVTGVALAAWKISGALARKWVLKEDSVQPLATTFVLSLAAILTSTSALKSYSRTVSEMARSSTRHPFCAFHLVGYRGVGLPVPASQADVQVRLRGLQSIQEVQRRERSQLELRVDTAALAASDRTNVPSKVIMVVVECLRPEVIEASTMPNLHSFAQRSIVLTNNFASGNATCHSMFGLVTGLESVWFPRKVSQHPIFNRLLREAGYELGFFGGQTDWTEYGMDGFINPTQFDTFVIEEPDLPGSDLRAVDGTIEFIDARDLSDVRKQERIDAGQGIQRAAICYLYATHSRFRYSDPQDQIFLPAASESVLMSRSGDLRDQFYNRYKNSLRTMDRMLAPLLRDDCVVMVMGDHGEPFLDDGTAIHGTRLSRFQNMTPALIYYPGVKPREISVPTFHSDLLPTLLSILQIPVSDQSVFDGRDLLATDQEQLSERTFVSSNFLDSTSVLIGSWSADPKRPFGFRVSFDIHDWLSAYLNPIDDQGYEWEQGADSSIASTGKEEFRRWMIERFGPDAVDESRSTKELFTEFFRSPDAETRLAALGIAGTVPTPEDYLYDLITQSTRDEVPEIRNLAKDLVIQINRFRGRASDATSRTEKNDRSSH